MTEDLYDCLHKIAPINERVYLERRLMSIHLTAQDVLQEEADCSYSYFVCLENQ